MPDPPSQVVVFLELRPCTLAALHHAATITCAADPALVVVYLQEHRQSIGALWAPPLLPDFLGIESAVFARVARILAPTGRSWSFLTASTPQEAAHIWRSEGTADLRDLSGDRAQTMLVHVCHRRGHHVCRPRDPLRRALTKLGPAPPPVQVVDCARPPSTAPDRLHSPHG
ncbi:hypothetical protein ABIA31_003774 [Catenulispora sp. MAP5-51]|uniref:hypothetical protein n=1 Tax=Catenulispora sp. MAP5-51 TaxID=3156298 RepID=UPI003514BCCE